MGNIVITGCSTGIGLTTANYLRDQHIDVYPTARDPKDVEMLRALGFNHAMQLDVTKYEEIASVIEYVLQQDGKIDAWFNNAGFGQPGVVEDITTETLRAQFETNLFGLHECTRQIIPVMRKQGGYGKIIQHSSVLGLVSLFGRGAYNASKYAIEGLTDTLRLELAETNIYPVLLNTGPIYSDFRNNALEKLRENVDIEHSLFRQQYHEKLEGAEKKVPFSEESISVAKVVHRIILAEKPKPRYYITKATCLLGALKRLLSTGFLDKLLIKIG
ncbi:MAG: SDR family NAD(P)-dependent oxidoreductase [Campylobacterota bacterium]|nr:SDR family NAD(P)-dependent oxidoreductase [Campylobacterota bacterium]